MPNEGHSKRVTAFTIVMARAKGLSSDQIRVIARGAFLHDIGKMAIPDAILRKPGPLTPEEVSIMREHCYHGYQIVKKIPFLAEASEIVYSQPGKMGRHRLSSRPAWRTNSARVAHLFRCRYARRHHSDRPYRPAQSLDAAKEEIKRFAGRQFDPEVVETFLTMPDHIWDDLRKEIDNQIYKFGASLGG